ncbi:MAG: hypothetical protein ACLSFT_10965 [Ruminococcus callidus]
MTGLTPEEINLALEYYSQKTQVDSLDAYFASKDKPKSKQERSPVTRSRRIRNRQTRKTATKAGREKGSRQKAC